MRRLRRENRTEGGTRRGAIVMVPLAVLLVVLGPLASLAPADAASGTPTVTGSLVGSWLVTGRIGATTYPNLFTLAADGTVLVSGPSPTLALPGQGGGLAYFSLGQGAWVATAAGGAALTYVHLVTGAPGTAHQGRLVGINTVHATIAVTPDGNAFSGRFSWDAADAQGKTVATITGTLQGRRIAATRDG